MEWPNKKYIIITGAGGFIGNCLARHFNYLGQKKLVLVDDFTTLKKLRNWADLTDSCFIDRELLFEWLELKVVEVLYFVHLGARTDTTEMDYKIHERLNLNYSKVVWEYCATNQIPLIFASSASTYGSGQLGYEDDHQIIPLLKPLNPYGISKNLFDRWVLNQTKKPPNWVGLKFFNVYGPGEYAKENMASVIFRFFNQIQKNGTVELYKSYHPDFEDGKQLRDFVYVKDILKVINWIVTSSISSGIYNLGTGEARSYLDLVELLFLNLKKRPQIKFIDIPVEVRETYQYYTQASMRKLKAAGYVDSFFNLENGIKDYVGNYLDFDQYKKGDIYMHFAQCS
jgi:ADP-L-glycero-D-manno-heptose 6-epimerase